jgi:hypothetical protein
MNTNTGKVYEGDAIKAAQDRGEPLVEVSPKVASLVEQARALRLEEKKAARRKTLASRNRARKAKRPAKRAMANESRRRNR